MPHTKYHKGKIEDHVLEIKQILGTLTSLSSSLNGNLGEGKYTPHVAPCETTVTSVSMNGVFLASPSLLCEKLIPPPHFYFSTSNVAACGRLVKREFAPHELPSLIEAIFSSNDGDEMIRCLPRDDAQTFIDVIDEARSTFTRYRVTNIDVFLQLGAVFAWSLPASPKEMPQVDIQDVWPTRTSSRNAEGSHLL